MMRQLDHERIVALSVADLDMITGALAHLADAFYEEREGYREADVCAAQAIVEQLRGKFDL